MRRTLNLGSRDYHQLVRWLDLRRAEEMTRSAFNQLGVRWERRFDERGMNISGGDRQSLAIARAMFFGSSLLILDEPTSALEAVDLARARSGRRTLNSA